MAYKFTMGTAILSGALVPAVDDSYDLGTATAQWQDLYLDGRATIDALTLDVTAVTATGAELNYLDITTLGTAAASKALTIKGDSTWTVAGMTCADIGTVTTADINGGNIDGTIIGASSVAAGSFAAVVGTTGTYSAGLTATTISGSGLISGAGNAEFKGGSITAASGIINGTLSCDTSFTLDAVTINATEMGYLDTVVAGTALASKAVVLDASKNIATIGTIGCGAITSTGASSYGTLAGGQVSSSAGFISPVAQTSNLGKLNVKGRLTAQGNSMFDGNVRVSGSVTLGNASADVVDSLGAVLGLPNLNATTGSTVKMLAYSALGNVETRTRAQFVADIAGTGLSTSGGKLVLSADTTTVTAFANEAATLVEGFNYASAALTADRILTLPASAGMAVGDVVQVKVATLNSGIRAIIARAGSQTIDGANEIYLDSSYGAVSLKYVSADTWRIF
jgi:hypothetical protein